MFYRNYFKNEEVLSFEWDFLWLLSYCLLSLQSVGPFVESAVRISKWKTPAANYKTVEKFNASRFFLSLFLLLLLVRYRPNDNSHCLFDVCDFIPILNGYLFGWTIRVSVKVICCQYKICMHIAHGILCDELIYTGKTRWRKSSQLALSTAQTV